MSVFLSPSFGIGWQGFTVGGLPLNGGLLYTYIAGGTTPQATYTTYLGNTQNSNPIQLGVDGRPPNEVWLTHGVSYRFDLKDSLGNLIPLTVKVGDIVSYYEHATTTVDIGGVDHILIKEGDIELID